MGLSIPAMARPAGCRLTRGMSIIAVIVTVLAIVMNGAMAGLFFAFSTAVMPGFDAAKPTEALAAMQSINRKIINPRFLLTFVGGPIVALVAGVLLLLAGDTTAALYAFAGGVVAVLGSLVLTGAVNVPMNNAIDRASSADAERTWAEYSPRWTRFNTLRGWACAIAAALLAIALTY